MATPVPTTTGTTAAGSVRGRVPATQVFRSATGPPSALSWLPQTSAVWVLAVRWRSWWSCCSCVRQRPVRGMVDLAGLFPVDPGVLPGSLPGSPVAATEVPGQVPAREDVHAAQSGHAPRNRRAVNDHRRMDGDL